jgi:hypothetical protein
VTELVWQPEEIGAGLRWRIVQLLPADGWWHVERDQRQDVAWLLASPLLAWALVELEDPASDAGAWQQLVGLDRWCGPASLDDLADYRRERDLPDEARLSDGGPCVEWLAP